MAKIGKMVPHTYLQHSKTCTPHESIKYDHALAPVVAAKPHPKAVAQTLPAPINLNLVLRVGLQEAQGVAAPTGWKNPCSGPSKKTSKV